MNQEILYVFVFVFSFFGSNIQTSAPLNQEIFYKMCLCAEKFSLSPNLFVFCWPTLSFTNQYWTEGLEVLRNTGVRICLETDFHFKQVLNKKFLMQRRPAGDNIFRPTPGLFERILLSNQIEQDAVVDWDKNPTLHLEITRLIRPDILKKYSMSGQKNSLKCFLFFRILQSVS